MGKLKYSIEQLIHFTCPACNYSWTHSGEMPFWIIQCPQCVECFEPGQTENITTRPLIEAFSDEELASELIRRNSVDFTQVSSGIAGLALKKLLDNDGTIEIPSLGIKINAISHDAGMPQRGVK